MAFVTHHSHVGDAPRGRRVPIVDWASDRAAEVAQELGFAPEDLSGLVGTGRDGSVTVKDVKNWGK